MAVNKIKKNSVDDINGHTVLVSNAHKSLRSTRSPSPDVKSINRKKKSNRSVDPPNQSSKRFPLSSQKKTGWDLKQASKSFNETLHIES